MVIEQEHTYSIDARAEFKPRTKLAQVTGWEPDRC